MIEERSGGRRGRVGRLDEGRSGRRRERRISRSRRERRSSEGGCALIRREKVVAGEGRRGRDEGRELERKTGFYPLQNLEHCLH